MTVEFVEDIDDAIGPAMGGEGVAERPRPPEPPLITRPLSKRARKAIMRRRDKGIRCAIGPNGSGKSAVVIMDLLPVLEGQEWVCDEPTHAHTALGITAGLRRVLSTVEILDHRTGLPHELYTALGGPDVVPGDPKQRTGGWWQVLEAEHCDIVFDEVTGIAGARESMGLPVAVQTILQQLRKRDVHLMWTAPNWERADSIIRGCTQLVSDCRGWMPDRSKLKAPTPPAWLPRRLFKVRTFDATSFGEWSAAKAAQGKQASQHSIRPLFVQWWWGPDWFGKGAHRVFASYNTLAAVNRIGEVLDSGKCAHCGGYRPRIKCECDH